MLAFKAVGASVLAHRSAVGYLNSETAQFRLKISRDELFPWIDEAYARTDWPRFERFPLFWVANRINAHNTYLLVHSQVPVDPVFPHRG